VSKSAPARGHLQATKLLDADALVRKMAEQDLLTWPGREAVPRRAAAKAAPDLPPRHRQPVAAYPERRPLIPWPRLAATR